MAWATLQDLVPLMEETAKSGHGLLVIAEEVEGDALATLVGGDGNRAEVLTVDCLVAEAPRRAPPAVGHLPLEAEQQLG